MNDVWEQAINQPIVFLFSYMVSSYILFWIRRLHNIYFFKFVGYWFVWLLAYSNNCVHVIVMQTTSNENHSAFPKT